MTNRPGAAPVGLRQRTQYLKDFIGKISTFSPILTITDFVIKQNSLTERMFGSAISNDVDFVKVDTCQVASKPFSFCFRYKFIKFGSGGFR